MSTSSSTSTSTSTLLFNALETSSCEIPTEFLVEETFTDASEFENTSVIQWMHNNMPRFGYPRELSTLMTGTAEEQTQYKKGLIATSYTMICIFVLWSVLLLLFKWMGPTKAGILSGESPTISNTPPRRKRIFRGIFLFAGISIIICSILMSLNGVDSLTHSLSSGREGIQIAKDLLQQGIGLLDDVIQQNTDTGKEVDSFLNNINEICPNFEEAFESCNLNNNNANISNNTSNNNNSNNTDVIVVDLSDTECFLSGVLDTDSLEILQTVLDHFLNGDDSLYAQELVQLRTNLQDLVVASENADDTASNFNWALYCAMGFSITLSVICFLMILGELFRISNVLKTIRSWFVMPIFIIAVTCSLLFSSIFVIWSMAVADLCIDSPDTTLLSLLDRFQEELSPILVESATFYISHCPADQIPNELTSILMTVSEAVPYIDQFLSFLETNDSFIQSLCGLDDPAQLSELSTTINSQICNVSEILNNIRLYFQCHNWYTLYETVMYDAVCYEGTSGFAWIVSTQFIIVVMAMTLLALRGILYDDDVLISRSSSGGFNEDGKRSDNSSETKLEDTVYQSRDDDGIEVCVGSSSF